MLFRSRLKKVFTDDEKLLDDNADKELLIHKVWFLSTINYFEKVNGKYLYHLAMHIHDLKSENMEFEDIIKSDLKDKFIIVKGDGAIVNMDDSNIQQLQNGEIYDMNIILNKVKQKISIELEEKNTIYFINKQDLINNILDFQDIERSVILWLESQFESIKN